jgi:3-hydroxymyristoyl/3-hydroxydecanoyl-(acyl carrier protein) dehydratase
MHGLIELCDSSFSPDHPVAFGPEGPLLWNNLMADVAACRAHLQIDQTTAYALFETDSYKFAVALLALLAENCRVYLPGENHEGVVEALQLEKVAFIGDFAGLSCLQVALSRIPAKAALPNLRLGGEVVVFTSGSTGAPKAIVKSLLQIDAELKALESAFGAEMGDCRIFSTVSHQHFYGLLFSVLWPLCAGRIFWRRPFIDPMIMAAETMAIESSVWVMSPGHLHRLSPDMPWASLRGAVKAVFSSGGPLDAGAAQAVATALGAPPWEVLGSSETGGIACRQQFSAGEPWHPMEPVEVRLGESGALMVRSPFLPDSDWYQSADQASLADDGRFILGRRIDRIVKLEGKRVSLPEVEAVLQEDDWVMDAHTLVIERNRQVVAAVIVLTETGIAELVESGQQNLFRRLRARLSRRLPAVAIPRLWRVMGALPRNAQGKLVRARMENLFGSRRLPMVLGESYSEVGCALTLFIDRSSPYFEGHFSQAAVLPGVVQIMWAEQFARDYVDLVGEFSSMQKVKFKDIVSPGAVLTLSLNYDASKGQLDFRYESTRSQHSQGRLRYEVDR